MVGRTTGRAGGGRVYAPSSLSSWLKANKSHLDVEDGQKKLIHFLAVSPQYLRCLANMDATRISDGRPVMFLKKLLKEEGPHELQMNKHFSTGPLSSDPRNHCVPLLDVVELRDEPPILVHPLLRCHYDPRFQTFGEFVTFFAQTCQVSLVTFLTIVWF
jgi:hypothetical protein